MNTFFKIMRKEQIETIISNKYYFNMDQTLNKNKYYCYCFYFFVFFYVAHKIYLNWHNIKFK